MSYEGIDLHSLAARLVSARKAAGITQEAAADHLGMSRPTYIAIEKSMRRPRPDELLKLAELFKEPLNRLLRSDKRPGGEGIRREDIRPHLRSRLEESAHGEQRLDAAIEKLIGFVDDYQYLESLVGERPLKAFVPEKPFQQGAVEAFADYCAQEERERLNLGAHQPIYRIRNVLEEAGLHVFADRLHSSLAGLYAFVPEFGYCILLNSQHPVDRRRWTTAHEYGHFLMERDKPGIDFTEPRARKSESERFADSFAASFLMPEVGVKRRFYDDVNRTGDFKVGNLCQLAEFYAVSLQAMTLRLESLSLLPRGSWDIIVDSKVPISAIKNEAGVGSGPDQDSSEIYPNRYRMLAVQAYNSEQLSEGELARLLRCSRVRAREIVEQCSEFLDDPEGDASSVRLELMHSLLATQAQ